MICRSCNERIEEGEFRCPKCNARVIDLNYFKNLDKMEEKYGTRNILELSKEKLTYPEVITIFTFIERADRHIGDGSVEDACSENGVFLNLHRRLEEIKEESKLHMRR